MCGNTHHIRHGAYKDAAIDGLHAKRIAGVELTIEAFDDGTILQKYHITIILCRHTNNGKSQETKEEETFNHLFYAFHFNTIYSCDEVQNVFAVLAAWSLDFHLQHIAACGG